MKKKCWEPGIRGRWLRIAGWLLVALLASAGVGMAHAATTTSKHKKKRATASRKKTGKSAGTAKRAARGKNIAPPARPKVVTAEAGTLAALGQGYRLKPAPATAAALKRYGAAHRGAESEGLADLALTAYGGAATGASDAVHLAETARKRLPALADSAASFEASAEEATKDHSGIPAAVQNVYNTQPPSPLAGRAALLEARVAVADGQPKRALETLDAHGAEASPAGVALLRGRALEALGRTAEAAEQYRRVFYDSPMAPESGEAAQGLARLRDRPEVPPVSGDRILARAARLMDGGQYGQARTYLGQEMGRLDGAARDHAQVEELAARLMAGDAREAAALLKQLRVDDPEADAERLYYSVRAASRLDREPEMDEALNRLSKAHPDSPWRQRALILAGNRYLVENQPQAYVPLFRACYESYPDSPDAAYCHWKVVWRGYLDNRDSAEDALKTHLVNYPRTKKADAAMYFLGRIAEQKGERGQAAGWYGTLLKRYPNSYYAILARERMKDKGLTAAGDAPEVKAVVEKLPGAARPAVMDFSADGVMKARIARARLLASAGMDDYAEGELRFGAEHDGQPEVAAMELAAIAHQRDAADQAIRYIKRYVPGYLYLPLSEAPVRFWEFAFPLPYRKALEGYSEQHGLDPYLVAALVRQESEFNPRAVSVSRALGLTQVEPATGKYLSRKVGITRYRTALLFQPEVNLRIGTYYLRTLLDGLRGSPEAALASYNAGKSRVEQWLTWAEYREPAEFVESIPFTQTRDYVEIVLHNADIYRRIYGNSQLRAQSRKADDERKF